jgi:hypothetical protein
VPFCTGQGTDDVGGCCHLGNGNICPHYRSTEDLSWIRDEFRGADVALAEQQVQGIRNVCLVAIRVITEDPTTLQDRPLFEQRWTEHPDYVHDVRPHWEALEARMGYEPGSYNCSTWDGTQSTECCWLQDDATCEAQAVGMSEVAVSLRRGRTV